MKVYNSNIHNNNKKISQVSINRRIAKLACVCSGYYSVLKREKVVKHAAT